MWIPSQFLWLELLCVLLSCSLAHETNEKWLISLKQIYSTGDYFNQEGHLWEAISGSETVEEKEKGGGRVE